MKIRSLVAVALLAAVSCFSQTAFGQAAEDSTQVSFFYSELQSAQKRVAAYDPKTTISIASGVSYEWLMRAVSPKERKEFMDKWGAGMTTATRAKYDAAFETLAKTAAEKIALASPAPGSYPVKSPVEEKMMLTRLSDFPGVKVYSSGLEQAAWMIEKNDFDIPTARYKHGRIWGKDPNSDTPYCRVWFVNIIQNYAGGGRYGSSRAQYVDTNFAACPAGK